MDEERDIIFSDKNKKRTRHMILGTLYIQIGNFKFQIPLQIIFFGQQAENNVLHLLTDQNCQCSPLRRILDVEFFWLKKEAFHHLHQHIQEEMSGSVSLSITHKIQPMTSPQPGALIQLALSNPVDLFHNHHYRQPRLSKFLYAQG